MTDSMHQQLLGHLLGALDDDEQRWLEGRLEGDEERRRELVRWRRRLAPLDAMRPDFEPPPGLAERTCRMVEAFGPPPLRSKPVGVGMTPEFTSVGQAARVGWADMATVGAVLMFALFLVLPAIDGSRFHARLAACQNSLRQFGAALSEYGDSHGDALTKLARSGRLTGVGVLAASRIRRQLAPEAAEQAVPEAWLVSQTDAMGSPRRPDSPSYASGAVEVSQDWSGTWRDGTPDGIGDPPIAQALLADAPSVVLPGQTVEYHGGQGRNLLFSDGRVEFVSGKTHTGTLGLGGSAPIIFVNSR
ncbi:MAG: hypothetical protein LLG00_09465 [Planctomycetaceae bacterium]|nr:hypothetical protein [Planctomycetaceae bacterium]